jgi:hypothetical protein
MRKTFILIVALFLVVGFSACKKSGDAAAGTETIIAPETLKALGKYAEIAPTLEGLIKANENYAEALAKATKADEVAAAMDILSGKMEALAPKMKAIEVKFPEFKNQDEPPAELKPYMDRVMGAMGKMMEAMGKVAQFAADPKVMAAQEKYNKVMAGLN